MDKVISIYELRTHLSKYIGQAKKGKTIYVGAYGQAQAVLAPLPDKDQLNIGVWAAKKQLGAYDYDTLVGPDPSTAARFETNASKDS